MQQREPRSRRRVVTEVKGALRELRNELSRLNHQVSTQLGLKDIDLDCLDLINRHGPLGPSALARRAGLHPATVTGILDRLERDGWIARERQPDSADRRAVAVRALPGRVRELSGRYARMNAEMDELCADYTDTELALLLDFLRRTAHAGRKATDDLSAEPADR